MQVLSAALLLALAIPAFAADTKKPKDDPDKIGDRDVGKCINFYPIEWEIDLGRWASKGYKPHDRVTDPVITEYVNRIGQNVALHSDAKIPITFQVVKDESPMALAFMGGFVFINTGMLQLARAEDELAFVLGHEIAHVAARHMSCTISRGEMIQLLSLPATAGVSAKTRGRVAIGIVVGKVVAHPPLSRRREAEADYLGLQYSYATGYDPMGAITLKEKALAMHPKDPGPLCTLLCDHPTLSQRMENAQNEIQQILPPKPSYLVTTSEYQQIRERLIELEDRPEKRLRDPKRAVSKKPAAPDHDPRPAMPRVGTQ